MPEPDIVHIGDTFPDENGIMKVMPSLGGRFIGILGRYSEGDKTEKDDDQDAMQAFHYGILK
jgi:hypothetical protein